MTRRTLVSIPLAMGAVVFLAACVDSPSAPITPLVAQAGQVTSVYPDTTDFRNLSGQVWVCATGNQPGSDFHYKFWVRENTTGTLVATGVQHGVNIGQCALLATVPTNTRGHYTAVVKQDAPAAFYFAHGFCEYGNGFPTAYPPWSADLNARTITAALSNDAGMAMTFYNLVRQPN